MNTNITETIGVVLLCTFLLILTGPMVAVLLADMVDDASAFWGGIFR